MNNKKRISSFKTPIRAGPEELNPKLSTLDKLQHFQYIAMDATKMSFRDNSFDIVIDKGTYDALACGIVDNNDKSMIRNLTQEMLRVTCVGGATVIITHGTPAKRLSDLEDFTSGFKV